MGIFFLGFCLGGITEFGGERAVRRIAQVRQYRRRVPRRVKQCLAGAGRTNGSVLDLNQICERRCWSRSQRRCAIG